MPHRHTPNTDKIKARIVNGEKQIFGFGRCVIRMNLQRACLRIIIILFKEPFKTYVLKIIIIRNFLYLTPITIDILNFIGYTMNMRTGGGFNDRTQAIS